MLRPGPIYWLLVVFLAPASSGHLRAGSLDKVLELDLKKALRGEHLGPGQSFKVVALSFSPDAQQIVIRLRDNAVLFNVQEPKAVPRVFQSLAYHDSFGWSPDGRIIYSGEHIVNLAGRRACDLPRNALFPSFIGKDSLVAMFLSAQHPQGRATLRFFDGDCREQDNWEVPAGWLIRDASPDRGLLSVWEIDPHLPYGHTEVIVSPLGKKVLRSRSVERGPIGWFANRGSALCGGKICWDVDTANQIGEAPVAGSVSSGS